MLRVHCAVPEVRSPTPKGAGRNPYLHTVTATIARGKRPVPSRTRKLSLSAPMVLRGPPRGRVGRRRTHPPIEAAHNPGRPRSRLWDAIDEVGGKTARTGAVMGPRPAPKAPAEHSLTTTGTSEMSTGTSGTWLTVLAACPGSHRARQHQPENTNISPKVSRLVAHPPMSRGGDKPALLLLVREPADH